MLDKRDVILNLKMLERRFNEAIRSPQKIREANFFAKLAVLEASGWLEQCVEKIHNDIAVNKLLVPSNINDYKKIIEDNHGFQYHKYIKNNLSRNLVGMVIMEKIENKLGSKQKFIDMKAALISLKTLRGDLAHNYLRGTTPTLQNVSITIMYFNQAYEGLVLFKRELGKIQYM